MSQHLIKLSVGVKDVNHLARLQERRLADAEGLGKIPELKHVTRNTPKRAVEILKGGSIYWVIKGAVRARQRIVDIDTAINYKGLPRCALIFDPELVPVRARPCRAFQGWRYLESADVPEDAIGGPDQSDDMPVEMVEELRALGLL